MRFGCANIMKYELNDYHRDVSDEELLSDVLRVAKLLDADYITMKQYNEYGKFSYSTIQNHFKGWSNALLAAGLEAKNIKSKKKFHNPSNAELIEDIKRVAVLLASNSVLSSEYDLYGKYSHMAYNKIYGSWDNALAAAGLESTGFHRNISEIDLFNNIEEMWIKLGRQPKASDFEQGHSKYGIKTYFRHFGSWRGALTAFVAYMNGESTSNCEETPSVAIPLPIREKAEVETINSHKTQRDIGLKLRFLVMKRDNFKCCMCGASPAKDPSVELHIDHIIPWAKGGETTFDNLQTLCSKCNLGKSDLFLDENT